MSTADLEEMDLESRDTSLAPVSHVLFRKLLYSELRSDLTLGSDSIVESILL